MRTIRILLLVAAVFSAIPAAAQTNLTTTTVSGAITNATTTQLVVASATGITANTTGLFVTVTGEWMPVTAVSGTTITVLRGQGGMGAWPIANSALVVVAPNNATFAGGVNPQGNCTGANTPQYRQRINVNTGDIAVCLTAGTWQIRNGIPVTQPTTIVLTP